MPNIYGIGAKPGAKQEINDIINNIVTNGAQRSNRYSVHFENCPVQLPNIDTNYNFFATMCQLPERSIQIFQDSVGPYSPSWDIPLKTEYDDDYIINFLVDGNWNIRKLMEGWMDYVSGAVRPGGIFSGRSVLGSGIMPTGAFPADGVGNDSSKIVIKGFKTADNTVASTLTLYGAWPKTILPSNMDTNANNQPLLLSVVFSYRYYRFS